MSKNDNLISQSIDQIMDDRLEDMQNMLFNNVLYLMLEMDLNQFKDGFFIQCMN